MKKNIVYFPFTHLSEASKAILSALFSEIAVLDISGPNPSPAEEGLSRISVSPELVAEADLTFEQYLDWIKIHKGNEHNLKVLLQENPYFREDTMVTSIKSQLKAGTGKADKEPVVRKIQTDLLFLKAAALCDAQNESIDLNLVRIDRAKSSLIEALKGENDAGGDQLSAHGGPIPSDPGTLMTRQRVSAWGACMEHALGMEPAFEPILVTTSPAVFELFEANASQCLNALDIDGIKVHENVCENKAAWQSALLEQLTTVAGGGDFMEKALPGSDDACTAKVRLKVNLFSGDEINYRFGSSQEQVAVCLVESK